MDKSGETCARFMMKRFVGCVWTPPSHDKATYERNRIRRREVDSSTQKRLPPGRYLFSSPQSPNGSVDKFLAHHLSVRPLLNGYLAHVERTPLGMIGIVLIFLHGHVVGVIAVESFQRFSTDDLSNQVLNCRLGGFRAHPNLLL